MPNLFLPVILGSARKGRVSEVVARFVLAQVKAAGVHTELIDPRVYLDSFATEGSSKAVKHAYAAVTKRADGFILVTPEYSHGYPGELKLMMDQDEEHYSRKPIAVVGVSSGAVGGARVADHIRPVLVAYDLVVSNKTAYFADATRGMKFDQEHDVRRVKGLIADVIWLANTLKAGDSAQGL